jgi:hypothetical protein
MHSLLSGVVGDGISSPRRKQTEPRRRGQVPGVTAHQLGQADLCPGFLDDGGDQTGIRLAPLSFELRPLLRRD